MEMKTDHKVFAVVTIAASIIGCIGVLGGAIITILPNIITRSTPFIQTPVQASNTTPPSTIAPTMAVTSQIEENLFDNTTGRIYILGYASQDISVQVALRECNNCPTVYLTSLNELPENWYHYTFHVGTLTNSLPDSCRTKQDLINLGVTRVMMTNWTSCP